MLFGNPVDLYFSGVRGVERYEHASLAASLEKNVNAGKTIIVLFVVTLRCYLITNQTKNIKNN